MLQFYLFVKVTKNFALEVKMTRYYQTFCWLLAVLLTVGFIAFIGYYAITAHTWLAIIAGAALNVLAHLIVNCVRSFAQLIADDMERRHVGQRMLERQAVH